MTSRILGLGVLLAALLAAPAHAASIAFVRDGDLWLAAPDASHALQLTHDGGYSSPSQADDGTLVALRAGKIVRLDRRGVLLNPPVATFTTPASASVSPDGTRVAYTFFHTETTYDYGCACVLWRTTGNTAYSYADRYTDPGVLGSVHEWFAPTWLDNERTLLASPGSGQLGASSPNLIYHWPGHAGAEPLNDLAHAGPFFDDAEAPYIQTAAVTRAGDRLAAAEGLEKANRIRLYRVARRPAEGDPAPEFRCELGAEGFAGMSWSPDGSQLAYAAGGDVYVAGDGCAAPVKLIAGASSPAWGPADVPAPAAPAPPAKTAPASDTTPPRLSVKVLGRRVVRVTVSEPARIAVVATAHGRRVATGSARAKRAGAVRIRLRARGRLRLVVRATDAAGNVAKRTARASW